MHEYLVYLLKVMLFQSICYAVYWMLFRRLNHFSLNRAFLLCTLLLGFIVPVVILPATVLTDPVIPQVSVISGTFSEVEMSAGKTSATQQINEYPILLGIIYALGVVILIVRAALNVMRILRIKAKGIQMTPTDPKVVATKEQIAFSFINTIVIHESAEPAVLLHEKGHVAGKHWLDLFFVEFACIVYWINPVVWLYRKSLRQQHEYLADNYVLRYGVSREDYLTCILNSLSWHEPIGPIHKFNSQSLKQRISMMTNNPFLPYSKVTYLAIVPLIAVLFLSFTERRVAPGSIDAAEVIVIDAGHGGSDVGSKSASGIAEKDIVLELSKLVQQIGKKQGLQILLTRTKDEELSLRERVEFSSKAKATVFLSLHAALETGAAKKGADMYVSEENSRYADSKRLTGVLSSELHDIKALSSLKVQNSSAFVLSHNQAPGAILELGSLSDEQDARFISDPANQQKIAERIVSALIRY